MDKKALDVLVCKLTYRAINNIFSVYKYIQLEKPLRDGEIKGDLKGPAIIASTHHQWEWFDIQKYCSQHIHWLSDPTYPWDDHKRFLKHWLAGPFLKRAGQFGVDRRRSLYGLRDVLDIALQVLRQGDLLGVVPIGRGDQTMHRDEYITEHGGVAWIAQKAQEELGETVPIYPVALKDNGDCYELVWGDPLEISNDENRKKFSDNLLVRLEKLADNNTSLQQYSDLRKRQKEHRTHYMEWRNMWGKDLTLPMYYELITRSNY